jgi:hypothetical protein
MQSSGIEEWQTMQCTKDKRWSKKQQTEKQKEGKRDPTKKRTGANSGAMLTVVHYRKVHRVAITLLTFISQFTDRLRLEINTS